jgi:hypothetical protein
MVYHRYIENIKDLKLMFGGKATQSIIQEWKKGQLEYLIEIIGHPYHKAFFSKPELVMKWKERICDSKNIDEQNYRKICKQKKRTYLKVNA